MKLYQRGRVWYLTFYVRGKRVQESSGTSDRRKAEKFCALRLSEVEGVKCPIGEDHADAIRSAVLGLCEGQQAFVAQGRTDHDTSEFIFGYDVPWERRGITDRAIQTGSAETIGQSGDGQS